MKIHLSFSLLITLFIFSSSVHSQKKVVQLPEVAKEIKKMRDEDQKMRMKWVGLIQKGKDDTEKFKVFTNELIAKDRANTARMREIITEHGWPTYDLVGEGPSNSAWLIVQHADRNPLFQIKCLPLLKAAVDNEQANPSNYAYLYDRVQVAIGEKQLYATQSTSNNGITEGYFQAIADESNVQKRREEMGIERSVEEYAQSTGFTYTIPTAEEAEARAKQLELDYQSKVVQAKEAMSNKEYAKAADFYTQVSDLNGFVTTTDFVEAARALSLAKDEKATNGTVYLTRAMARGWDGFDEINANPDFAYLKEVNASNWDNFLITVKQMDLDR